MSNPSNISLTAIIANSGLTTEEVARRAGLSLSEAWSVFGGNADNPAAVTAIAGVLGLSEDGLIAAAALR